MIQTKIIHKLILFEHTVTLQQTIDSNKKKKNPKYGVPGKYLDILKNLIYNKDARKKK
jgi:hypothetical protein